MQGEADRDDVDAEPDRLGEADERDVVGDVPGILQESLVHDDFIHVYLLTEPRWKCDGDKWVK